MTGIPVLRHAAFSRFIEDFGQFIEIGLFEGIHDVARLGRIPTLELNADHSDLPMAWRHLGSLPPQNGPAKPERPHAEASRRSRQACASYAP
ncbi:hypothetical protein [Aquabacter sp. CN5-332]|uniref:hypothetical protein n=1 Tax=Aquabacter sp. CN5-332 TaxID=3156608 RepID=UPI0032B47B70